jgi:hypothetical protein
MDKKPGTLEFAQHFFGIVQVWGSWAKREIRKIPCCDFTGGNRHGPRRELMRASGADGSDHHGKDDLALLPGRLVRGAQSLANRFHHPFFDRTTSLMFNESELQTKRPRQ